MNSNDIIAVVDHLKDIITPIGAEVYAIYYKQMFYTGVMYTIAAIIVIFISLYCIYQLIKTFNSTTVADDDDAGCTAFAIVVFCIIIIVALITLPSSIMHIMNPDYYIIQNLLYNV